MNMQQLIFFFFLVVVFASTTFSLNISSSTVLNNQASFIQKLGDQVEKLYNLTVSLDQRVTELQQENGILKRHVTAILETQSNLTRTDVELNKELLELKQKVESSPLADLDIKGNMFSLRNDVSALIGSLTPFQQSMASFRDDLTYMHNENLVMHNKTSHLTDMIISMQESFKHATTIVAFTATNTRKHDIRGNEVIIFDKMTAFVGNEYNPNTGIFTTGFSGLYAFFVNIRTQEGRFVCWIDIVKNGDSVGTIYMETNSSSNGDSTLVIVPLITGDTVWIRKSSRYETYTCSLDNLNTFTGVLIHRT